MTEYLLERWAYRMRLVAGLMAVLLYFVGPAGANDNVIPPPLPEPVSNNAVAEITLEGRQYVMSFMGIGPGKTATDIKRSAWLWTSQSGEWAKFPDVPVFGHAGGIVGDTMIVAGGVGVTGETDGKREFSAIDQAFKGTINPANPDEIEWKALPSTLGTNRYRMAATGDDSANRVFFAGGTARPYNFSCIGYDGQPAEPTGAVFAFDLEEDRWILFDQIQRPPSMDHRGLLRLPDGALITIGGMGPNQQVLDSITVVEIPSR